MKYLFHASHNCQGRRGGTDSSSLRACLRATHRQDGDSRRSRGDWPVAPTFFVQVIASLRSPRRERPSGRGLGAWRNDNRLYHRKNTAKLHVQNGCPIHSYCNPNDNGLPCCNGLTGVSANKNVELAFTLMLTKVQRVYGVFKRRLRLGLGFHGGC